MSDLDGRLTLAEHAKLAELFAPGTLQGHADRIWEINLEIAALRSERTNLERILLDHCAATGEVIEGKIAPPIRAHWVVDDVRNGQPVWKPKLEFERRDQAQRR